MAPYWEFPYVRHIVLYLLSFIESSGKFEEGHPVFISIWEVRSCTAHTPTHSWPPNHWREEPGGIPGSPPQSLSCLHLVSEAVWPPGVWQTVSTEGEMQEASWNFHYLDNRRQEAKKMAYEHLQALAQRFRQICIYSLLTGLEVHKTNSMLSRQTLSATGSCDSYRLAQKTTVTS